MQNNTVTTLQPTESCTPSCDDGKILIGSCSTLLCPSSGNQPACLEDASAGTWWVPCGFGDVCLNDIVLGSATYEQYGTFQCVDPGSPEESGRCDGLYVATTPPPAEGLTTAQQLDIGTLSILGGLVMVAIVGALISCGAGGGLARCFFMPGPKQWSPGNVLGVLVALIAVVAACLLPDDMSGMRSTGLASGIAALLTVLWSFFKAGVHDVMGMTREAAWRVHTTIGLITLIVAVVHGSIAIAKKGSDISQNAFWVVGIPGAVLMILGVVAAPFVHYDKFKLLHFLSMWGYIASLVHMMDHAYVFQSPASISVAAANAAALLAFIVQKVYTKVSAGKVTVQKAELVSESGGQHLFLTMSAPNFKFQPGQWGHLAVKSASPVPHPFTLIPGETENEVRIFMKINRSGFTSKMAKLCSPDATAPDMKLEGPYGRPSVPAPGMERTVFVLGGVGITPGLSLAKAAAESSGAKVPLFWALRSLELLQRCSPLLEPHLDDTSCVRLNGAGTQEGGVDLPLQAQYGSEDIGAWLDAVGTKFVGAGVKNAMVFVCGPPGLADAAKAAAKRSAGGIPWHLHVEEFLFLPAMGPCTGKASKTQPAAGKK